MARRQSTSDVAIDIGIARSTDFGKPSVSARVSPRWRAPRPVSWPPALPPHRVPDSAPRSAPPSRFHEPVLHSPVLPAPVLHPPVLVPDLDLPKARIWPWAVLLVVLAAGGAGFVLRQRLLSDVATASTWLRDRLPSDLAERPALAWARAHEMLAGVVTRARDLVPGSRTSPPSPVAAPSRPASIPSSEPANETAPGREAPAVPVSALPEAPAAPAPRVATPRPRTVAPHPLAAPVAAQAESPAAPAPVEAPVEKATEPPASSPAPEPGSLDDLIRRAVEKERRQQR
jgi:hypothetical protein